MRKARQKKDEPMSQLITLAQRIKVIQSIQKTAHAMQLISMSTLSRLKGHRLYLQRCLQEVEDLLGDTQREAANTPITLLISSQKGFSGNFDYNVFELFKKHNPAADSVIIPLGKSAGQFLQDERRIPTHANLTMSPGTLPSVAQQLTDILIPYIDTHDMVHVVNTISFSIFLQKPQVTVIPLRSSTDPEQRSIFEYYLFIKIYTLLLESLIAENSARAISMESSTTNARNMLQKMKLDYNKLRQAKVTRELTELSSSLLET